MAGAAGALRMLEEDLRRRRPAAPDGLTRRELQIVALLAAGRSNREIADELVLSRATVQRHVANVYAKAGVRNRAELTAYALRHELVPA